MNELDGFDPELALEIIRKAKTSIITAHTISPAEWEDIASDWAKAEKRYWLENPDKGD